MAGLPMSDSGFFSSADSFDVLRALCPKLRRTRSRERLRGSELGLSGSYQGHGLQAVPPRAFLSPFILTDRERA